MHIYSRASLTVNVLSRNSIVWKTDAAIVMQIRFYRNILRCYFAISYCNTGRSLNISWIAQCAFTPDLSVQAPCETCNQFLKLYRKLDRTANGVIKRRYKKSNFRKNTLSQFSWSCEFLQTCNFLWMYFILKARLILLNYFTIFRYLK